ncbi:MAG: hypothetical protein L0Z70_08795 [Chloroflexi bacterium]|nr:hypothetical protein [Chloroflexota bacterium]
MEREATTTRSNKLFLRRLGSLLGWTRASYTLMSIFLLCVALIIYIWQPLARDYLAYVDWSAAWWLYMDWLLLGIFLAMSLLIMARTDLLADGRFALVAFVGGLVIEGWGTQTSLWVYYTHERPPLWILPAWPIAALATDRLRRALAHLLNNAHPSAFRWLYWPVFTAFLAIMLAFTAPTLDKPLTLLALLLCALLILSPTDHRMALLTFAAGAGLGYFLELWGTTRACWVYYTNQTPPLFAVLAHGMASLAFWRTNLLAQSIIRRFQQRS